MFDEQAMHKFGEYWKERYAQNEERIEEWALYARIGEVANVNMIVERCNLYVMRVLIV